MKSFWTLVAAVLFLLTALPTHAQESNDNCKVGSLSIDSTSASTTPSQQTDVTNPRPATTVAPTTDAEAYVQNVIKKDGLHVVHFWAPWCDNSRRELRNGWDKLVAANPNVTFTFVTVWNNGQKGDSVLTKHDLPARVTVVTQPDLGPSDVEANRRQSFLTHPVTWIPSTWIFHNNGELAFAMNYGEIKRETIQSLITTTQKDW